MKILLFFNYVFTTLIDTLKKKYLTTPYEISELIILKNPSTSEIITEIINQSYETEINDIKMYCGNNLNDNKIEITYHLGSSIIFPIKLFINELIQSTEFKNCFICDNKINDMTNVKSDLINICKYIWPICSNAEIRSIVDDIMCLDKTKIIPDNKNINVKIATEKCIEIFNKCYIHLNINDVPFLVEQKDPFKKNIISMFYLTFENKNNGKKYKTPIYRMKVKNYHVMDINEEFREEKLYLSIPLISLGIIMLLIIVIISIYIYKNYIFITK